VNAEDLRERLLGEATIFAVEAEIPPKPPL